VASILGARGAIAPPIKIKIYLGESIFAPSKFLVNCKNCTKNAPQITILRSKIKKISGEGLCRDPSIWGIGAKRAIHKTAN